MGVPTFYRWLVTRYPKIAKAVYETRDSDVYSRRTKFDENGEYFKVHDLNDYVNNTDELHCSDNINGYFDNMYLDMNGIIHLCSHSDNSKRAKSNEEIFLNVFLYVERLFDIVEPKKLLYMAIDGVAPKAKMNQQRSRRFKSISCSEIEKRAYLELKERFIAENKMVPEETTYWDSNVITPGTEFMHELSVALKYFIEHKITNDEKWKNVVVIFSDSNVCGEGEHKIFNFIKSQRAQPGYDPNTRHIIHGMDADLIMLSLASHEPYFYILREIIDLDPKSDEKEKPKKKDYVGMLKSYDDLHFCTRYVKTEKKLYNKYNDPNYANVTISKNSSLNYEYWNELQILDLTILREYLWKDLFFDTSFNMERCIDDFIFICFFCGNDFLPHLPSISIAGGSIDQLILLYQKVLPTLGDYLINEGSINLKSFTKYISFIAEVERETFVSQYDFKKKREKRELQQKDALKRPKCVDDPTDQVVQYLDKSDVNNKTNNAQQREIHTNKAANTMIANKSENITTPAANIVSKKMLYESKIQSMQPMRNIKYKDKKGEKSINFLVRPVSNIEKPINNEQEEVQSLNSDMLQKSETLPNNDILQDSDTLQNNNNNNNNDDNNNNDNSLFSNNDACSNNDTFSNTEVLPKDSYDENKKMDDINEFNLLLKEAIKKANECENPKEDVELGGDENPDIIRMKYYKSKFHLDDNDSIEDFIKDVVYKYVEGLAWVLAYYFQSCPMWHWYYPYYYAPLSSDLIVDNITFNFEKDEPLLPFEQLLCVLPANSSHCLPKMYKQLMLHKDSPIIDFYPHTFKEEENGKKFKYQWIILLPFVDKDRIIKHARPLHDTLNSDEKKRNRRGLNKIYVSSNHPLSKTIAKSIKNYLKEVKEKESIKNEDIENLNNDERNEANMDDEKKIIDKKNNNSNNNNNNDNNNNYNNTYDDYFKNMNLTIPITTNRNINLFGYLNCKDEESDVHILKKIFKFSSNFSSTCNSAFYLQPEFEKHSSALLKNHIRPKNVLNVLDINNEERKLRFNAPAAKRMILNSLSNNHPQIYSFSKYNQSRNQEMNHHYHNPNHYSNDPRLNNAYHYNNKVRDNMQNYNNSANYNYTKTPKNYNYHHNQNFQDQNYNNNFPNLSHKNNNMYQMPKKNVTYSHDHKKDVTYNNYNNSRNTYNKDNTNYESPYNVSYNSHYNNNNNYMKHKNDTKAFSNNNVYNNNPTNSYHHNNYKNYNNNYHNYHNDGNYYKKDPYHNNSTNNNNTTGTNKKNNYYNNRSMPYKDK
ncbi:exoribonuclease, putative [Plasmodium sp. gorilla clade G2]|uniref:exoribonuclease, putative n=1 Tax=Plasmodium sp. gorilla clade G2 TaxID=880535 RepID=UPI000D2136FB|nr:exoribonuclease, putative [Plasmodium sp. gorilla clade G2]SOV14061.1 exoribonuclease, putative [Plasmodium sp. gorilla clade G2]